MRKVTVELCCCGSLRLLPAWGCTSARLLGDVLLMRELCVCCAVRYAVATESRTAANAGYVPRTVRQAPMSESSIEELAVSTAYHFHHL